MSIIPTDEDVQAFLVLNPTADADEAIAVLNIVHALTEKSAALVAEDEVSPSIITDLLVVATTEALQWEDVFGGREKAVYVAVSVVNSVICAAVERLRARSTSH